LAPLVLHDVVPEGQAMSGIFDLKTSEEFFSTVLRVYDRYQQSNAKDVEDLLYVLMGLNHLREWIAPGYSNTTPPGRPEEIFYNEIWKTFSFRTINSLCNRTKHLKRFARPLPRRTIFHLTTGLTLMQCGISTLVPHQNTWLMGKMLLK
jgi:hypothetical protein